MIDTRQPVLIVVAGPNGSGKTTLTEQIIRHQWIGDCSYINPDSIAQELGDWNSPSLIRRAAEIASAKRDRCISERKSLAFETVLSAADKVDFIRNAKDAGYFVRVFFVGTDHPGINASRVAQRVMEGGHDVPIPKIISRYTKSIANCAALAEFVDRCYVYDNSIDGAEPRLLFRSNEGRVMKIYSEINPWARNIEQNLIDLEKKQEAGISPEPY